jgi:hypothetical protein
VSCDSIKALSGNGIDASGAIQTCIDSAPDGAVLKLPPGKYTVLNQIHLNKALSLVTQGKQITDNACNAINDATCAELVADPAIYQFYGLLVVSKAGVAIDHLVVNGNRSARLTSMAKSMCQSTSTRYGYNMEVSAPNFTLTNSVSKFGLCGTGLEITGVTSKINVSHNTFYGNGAHDVNLLWSDGLTVHDTSGSTFFANNFVDNTDIDFVLGGCQNCVIQQNQVSHSAGFTHSSFAALHIQAWPAPDGTSGNYAGSDISGNQIDCGPNRRCGFGIMIGGDPWYNSIVGGGSVHDNLVKNAELGVNVDRTTTSMAFYNNFAQNSMGGTVADCGFRSTGPYNISSDSLLDRSKDTIPESAYTHDEWDSCIPNHTDYVLTSATCDPISQPAPDWGVKNGACLASCGALGGTASFPDDCANHGLMSAGLAYDVAFCCK